MDPGCVGPGVDLVQPVAPVDPDAEPALSATIGSPITVSATLRGDGSIGIISAELIAATPGTDIGSAQAAMQPANQAVVSPAATNQLEGGQVLTFTWTPTAAGVYPVIVDVEYVQSDDCESAPPTPYSSGVQRDMESELATIVAS